MGKITGRIAKTIAPKTTSAERVDRWFSRASHASQVLLLALGVFGYFYTVLPIYQKSLLDEEIAQKTLELREKQRQTNFLEQQISERTGELQKKDQSLRTAEQKIRVAESSQQVAEQNALLAARDAQEQYQLLRAELVRALSERLKYCGLQSFFGRDDKPTINEESLRACVQKNVAAVPVALAQLKSVNRNKYIAAAERLLEEEFQPRYMEFFRKAGRQEAEAKEALDVADGRYKAALQEAGDDRSKRISVYNALFPAVSAAMDKNLKAREASRGGLDEILQAFEKRLTSVVLA